MSTFLRGDVESCLGSRSATIGSQIKPRIHAKSHELERLREQLGQMEIRAVAAEAEVTSLAFEKVAIEHQMHKHRDLAQDLNQQLQVEKAMNRKSQENVLEKINTIKEALTRQVEELRKGEKDANSCLEAIQELVDQFKSGIITKREFLSQVETIFDCHNNKKLLPPKKPVKAAQSSDGKFPSSHPLNLLARAALTNGGIDRVIEESSQDVDELVSPSPPPVPPRPLEDPAPLTRESSPLDIDLSSRRLTRRRLSSRVNSLYSLAAPPGSPSHVQSSGGFVFGHNISWSSDSEFSDGDDPHAMPMVKSSENERSRFKSPLLERRNKLLEQPTCPLPDSQYPTCEDFPCSIKKSSPVMVKRPDFIRKGVSVGNMQIARQPKKLARNRLSRSLDSSLNWSADQARGQPVALSDSEDTTGGSAGYSKPFHHIKMRKRFLTNRSVLSPHKLLINSSNWHRYDNSDDDEDTYYIDPSVVASRRPQKKKPAPLKSTSSDTYLSLGELVPARKLGMASSAHPQVPIPSQTNSKTKKPARGSLSDGTSDSELEMARDKDNIYEDPDSNRASPLFDNQLYEPSSLTGDGIYAKIEEFRKEPSPQSPVKHQLTKAPKLSRMDSEWLSEDGYARVAEFAESAPDPGPPSLPPRPPTFASVRPGNPARTVPGIGSLPRYTTLGGSEHEVRLVPTSWDTPTCPAPLSTSVPSSFHSPLLPKKSLQHSRATATPNLHGDDQSDVFNTYGPLTPRSATPTSLKKVSIVQQKRSSTLPGNVVHSNTPTTASPGAIEKRGYLSIQDGKQRAKKRWLVLKGSELKSYPSSAKENRRRARDVISLDKTCKLSTSENEKEFRLDVSGKVYRLLAQSRDDCEQWLNLIEAAMQGLTGESTDEEPTAVTSLSGWARVDGASTMTWCWSEGSTLFTSQEPGSEPSRELKMEEHSVRLRKDSILLDSTNNSRVRVLHVTHNETKEVTIIQPSRDRVIEEWCYILNSLNSQDSGPELTRTEQFLSEIMRDDKANQFDHFRWQNPIFKVTAMPLLDSLVSLPTLELKEHSRELFKDLQQFINQHVQITNLDFHIGLAQKIIGQCLVFAHLQNEVYCQLLRQMSGHTNPTSHPVLQGWLLLFMLLPMYLPSRKLISWYLSTFLQKSAISQSPVICDLAKNCEARLKYFSSNTSRQCTPTFFELKPLFEKFIAAPLATPTSDITSSVYLSDGSVHDVVFNATTTVSELTAELSKQAGLPDSDCTGFALMCDWPGVTEGTMCCPFPQSKVCDVISMWTLSVEELSQTAVTSYTDQRNITFTYKRRLAFRKQRGEESSYECVLLAHQINHDVMMAGLVELSREHTLLLSAMMAQLEYGDWGSLDKEEQKEYSADGVVRFCPWKMTHMALEHDRLKLEAELADKWGQLTGKSREDCARLYLSKAQDWLLSGATMFTGELQASPQVQVWLAVTEDGISVLKLKNTELIKFYSYSEISTFGGHGDNEFMLVACPEGCHGDSMTTRGEKVLFTMDKIQICEATFLMATYIECLKNNFQ